jgi:multidrug efflux pump subunit AcrB
MNITRYAIEKNRITASPKRVEMLVTDKIEKAIQEIPELEHVTSQSRNGFSLIFVKFKMKYKEMRPLFDKLRRKVQRVASDLPEDVIGPIVDDEFVDVFGIIFTLTGEGYTYAELKEVADQVRDELLMAPDVAKVEIHGAQEERIFVEYNTARLSDLGISPYQLRMMLESRNIIIPGGEVFTEDEQIALEPSGNFESVEDLKRTIINVPGRKELLYLGDIANVYRGYIDPPSKIMRASGTPCLGLAISMREGGNIITMGEAVRQKMQYLQSIYPIGIEFDTVAFQPDVVNWKISDFVGNLLQAIGIVTLVMLLFLGLRTGIVVATLIPMAMVTTLVLMHNLGIGMDQVSLTALIVALGMLVDNAIVMSENIMVKIQNGVPRMEAAVDSAKELKFPLLVASLTTSAAFLPFFLAKSDVGEYVASLFKVVTLTLLCSWALAITMIPMLCFMFLKVKEAKEQDSHSSRVYKWYRSFLEKVLRHRGKTLIVVALVFMFVMYLGGFVKIQFMPPSDKSIVNIKLEFPRGAPIAKTRKMVEDVDRFIENELKTGPGRDEGIVNWASFIGYGGTRFVLSHTPKLASPEYAFLLGNTSSVDVVPLLRKRLEDYCMERYPDLNVSVKPLEIMPVGKPIEIRIQGRDMDKLFAIVDKVKTKMAQLPGTRNIEDDWGFRTKKLIVDINQARALKAGVSSQDVALSLYTILSGLQVSEFRENEKVIPITLRTVAADRGDIGKLETIDVYSQLTGRSVPLKQIGDIRLEWQPSQILRKNRLLTVAVNADLEPGITAAEVNADLIPWMREISKDWEIGYAFEVGGETEKTDESNASIMEQMPIAFFIIFLLIMVQFNSARKTFIILITIPLGLIGVTIGLLITSSYFGFMTLMGVVSLAGIVINNAIVLLDRIRIEIEEVGLPPAQAVIEACQLRFRPILLTTATTIGGLLPLWLGGGPMWEPMVIGLIFGLLFGTLLTLVVVPVLYSLLFKVKYG